MLLAFGLVSTSYAQQRVSSPQPMPYIHTVVAGSAGNVAWTPVAAAGTTTAPAVHGSAPGDGLAATDPTVQFNGPTAIAVDGIGNLYITDSNGWVRRVGTDGVIKTFAGGIAKASSGSTCPGGTNVVGDGCPANEAYLKSAQGVAIDPRTGDIYISDSGDYRVRKIDHATYKITTIAGTGTKGNTDGDLATCSSISGATCSGTIAPLYSPRGMAVDRRGNLFIGEGGSTGSNGSLNYDVRLANFTTGKLTTIVNKTHTKACTVGMGIVYGTTKAADLTMGIAKDLAFDTAGNLYIADASCAYVYKVEAHGPDAVVDETSLVSIVAGNGLTNPVDPTTAYGYQLATSATIPAGSVKADANGNLYIGESQTSSPAIPAGHVWFYDAATGYVHPIFGGATPGDCFGVAASGTAPYNGCDGIHSSPATANGTTVTLDPWGNVYVADSNARFVHKLSLGTNAPFVATTPAGKANAVLHFGAGDGFGSLDTSLVPDFTIAQGTCATNTSDNTQDCGATVAYPNASANPVYEAFKVTSSLGSTSTVYLSNEVMPVCQSPIANDQTIELLGATASITLTGQVGPACSGAENPAIAPHVLTYSYTNPPNGTLSGTAPNLTYTPNDPNSTAIDSFTFTVTDKAGVGAQKVTYDSGAFDVTMPVQKDLVSAAGTVTIVPMVVPIAQNQSVIVPFNTATAIKLAATGNGNITYAVVSSPANGGLSGDAPNLTYTPNADFVGSDSFTFTATNTAGTSNVATVNVEVHPASVPTALAQSVVVAFDTPTPITLKAAGNGTITFAVVTDPAYGTLSGTAPNLTYTPTTGYVGADSFTFKASNILGESEVATVSITVNQAAPVANAQSVVVKFNTPTAITLTATGPGSIAYAVVAGPVHGTVTGAAPNLTYTPNPDYIGTDSFTFKANNGTDSNVATVLVTVNPNAPSADSQPLTIKYNTATPFTLSASGTGPLTYTIVAPPAHGTLSGTAPSLTYTPNSNYAGTDSFTFTASNAGGTSNVATVSITVGADFTWTLASGASPSATVNAGETATYNLMLSGWNGATNSVTLTCTGAPVPCSVTPNPSTLNGTTAIPVTVSVQTAGPHATAAASTLPTIPGNGLPLALTLTLAGIAALVLTARSQKLQWRLAGACAALLMVVSLTACGAGKQQAWNSQTPAGNYILTVTATSQTTTGNVSKSHMLTLNVR